MTLDFIREHNLILLECISGSRAYNLNVAGSDTDIKGVFYMPKEKFYGLEYTPQISNETNDIVFYEIGRFIELLLKNNPNILELLETPKDKILYKAPLMDQLKVEFFLSKKCKDTFGGYAFTQIRKARGLNKKIVNPIDKQKKTILDFCYVLHGQGSTPLKHWLSKNNMSQDQVGLVSIPHFKDTYGLYYDGNNTLKYRGILKKEKATTVLVSSIPKGEQAISQLYFNEDGFVKYCKDYKDYWDWVEKRNEQRYSSNVQHGKNYDSKNMMHTFRLLDMASEILSEQKIKVWRENREELLKIRNGAWSYDELIEKADMKMKLVEKACEDSLLPDFPDVDQIEKILIDIRNSLYD